MDIKKWLTETARRPVTDSTIAEILDVTRKTANKRVNEGLTADDLIEVCRSLEINPVIALVELCPLRGAFLGGPWLAVLLLARGFPVSGSRYWAWVVARGSPPVVGMSWGRRAVMGLMAFLNDTDVPLVAGSRREMIDVLLERLGGEPELWQM